jgi:hypothetical protein
MPSKQASAAFPENTLSSFEAAIRDGAEAIESGTSYRGLPSMSRNRFGRRPRLSGLRPCHVS